MFAARKDIWKEPYGHQPFSFMQGKAKSVEPENFYFSGWTHTLMSGFNIFIVRLVLEKGTLVWFGFFLPSPQNAKRYLTNSFVMLWYLQTR